MPVVYLVRHGQASFGPGDYDRLTDLGLEQADLAGRELARRLAGEGAPAAELVAHGGLKRQLGTAEAVVARLPGQVPLREHPGLSEFDHEEIILRHKPAYRRKAVMYADLARTLNPRQGFQDMFEKAVARWTGGEHDGAYGETMAQFHARVAGAFEDLTANASGTVVMASSGGAISSVCADLLGEGPGVWLQLNRVMMNAGITKVVIGKRGRSMVTFNDTGHLEHVGREYLTYR